MKFNAVIFDILHFQGENIKIRPSGKCLISTFYKIYKFMNSGYYNSERNVMLSAQVHCHLSPVSEGILLHALSALSGRCNNYN